MVASRQIELMSDGHFNVINITYQVKEFVRESGIRNGHVFVFFQHTTGAVIIGEHESGIAADINDMLEKLAPVAYPYKHHLREVDYNGHAHVRTALMPAEVGIPVIESRLALGTYQDVLVIDDQVDTEPRYVVFQAIGE